MSDGDGVRATVRRLLALEQDVLVLSVAMFAFSLGFQMTSRYVPRYISTLGAGGRVTGSYYLVRNVVVVPSAAVGGAVYAVSPETAFTVATAVGLLGVALFLVFGEEFEEAVVG